jgi:hemerythrin superfamily protein
MKNEITQLMLGHHALIDVLLTAFKDTLAKNPEEAEKLFDEFRWELDKHFFVEERAIFKFCEPPEDEICRLVNKLIKEHDLMLGLMNEMKNALALRRRVDVAGFQKILTEHREAEEKVLYPWVDQKLTAAEKEAIIERINEIPINE